MQSPRSILTLPFPRITGTAVALLLALGVWYQPAAACPDLTPAGFTLLGPQIVAPGEPLRERLFAFAHNTGTDQAGPCNIAFYISTDPIITTSDQILIGGRDFRDPVTAGGLDPVRRIGSLGVPGGWPAGPAYLGVIVDEFDVIAECSELNNTASFPVLVRTPQNVSRTVPTGYGTIAAAMAAAADGDTIRILTGDYDEAVAVTKDLVFVGSGPDSTVLRTSTNDDAIMDIAGGHSVTVRGIRFESQLGEPFFVARGIRDTAGTVAVTHCRFHTIPNWSLQVIHGTVSVDSCEFLMYAGAADVGVDAFHSVFWISDSYGGTRLDHVFDPWGTALGVVEDCTMDGSSVHWANGIRLRGSGPVALLRNNLIVGQHLGTEPWIQTVGGIAAFGPMFVEIYDNEIHGFTHGLNIGTDATARVHRNTITDNLLVGVECFNNPLLDLGGGVLGSPGLNLIQNNGTFSVRNKSAPDLFARYNYWGGGDSATIDGTMYDDEEDPAYGEVLFKPGGFILQAGKWVQLITELRFILTFDSVISAGVLSVIPLDAGPRPPGGVDPIPPVPPYLFDVVTDAVFMDDIEVCYEYDEALLAGSELATTMWHHDGSDWFNITTSNRPAEDMVCGTTRGLSIFMVGLMDFLCGDTDASGSVTSADIIRMVNHVFKGFATPVPVPAAGDANSDHVLTSADIIYLVNFVFKGGPEPECR